MQGGYPQGGYGGYGGGYPPQEGYAPPPQGYAPPQQGYGYPPQGYPPPQQGGGGELEMKMKMLELDVQRLQLENQQLRLENQQLKMGGGGGTPPPAGRGYPPQQGHPAPGSPMPSGRPGMGGAPAPTRPTRLYDAWKLTWDDAKCSQHGVLYTSGDAGRQTWVKTNDSFPIDFITAGLKTFQYWDLDNAASTKQFDKPSQWSSYTNVQFDVLEDRNLLVVGCKPSFEGNLILTYNTATEEWNELRKDTAEANFTALHCLAGTGTIVAAAGKEIRMFDLNTGRPFGSFQIPDWCEYITKDPTNPNLFYVASGSKIVAFDKSTKKEVRSFLGLSQVQELQVPVMPGNQLISCDHDKCLIWDVGTGRVVHTLPTKWSRRSSMYGNVVAICENSQMQIFDLLESATEPAKVLPQSYQMMQEVYVLPKKILVMTSYVWVTTPFSPAPAGGGGGGY